MSRRDPYFSTPSIQQEISKEEVAAAEGRCYKMSFVFLGHRKDETGEVVGRVSALYKRMDLTISAAPITSFRGVRSFLLESVRADGW